MSNDDQWTAIIKVVGKGEEITDIQLEGGKEVDFKKETLTGGDLRALPILIGTQNPRYIYIHRPNCRYQKRQVG